MPVTIEPVVNKDNTVDPTGPVTFDQYSEVLRAFHAEFIAVANEYGWDKPSAMLRRITLEFPERRNSKVTPAQISPDLTQDMFLPEGWIAFTAKNEKEYAARLVLFRKRLLKLSSEGYFDTGVASRVLRAAGLPPYEQPKGYRYVIGSGPKLTFTSLNRNGDEVKEEVNSKFAEFFAANGWVIDDGYTLPGVSLCRGTPPVPQDEMAPLL